MKKLLMACTLAFAGCIAPEMIEPSGAVANTVTKVVSRHDAYVIADEDMTDGAKEAALLESASSLILVEMPQVSAVLLGDSLGGVIARHDVYVRLDPALDELERSVYLGSSASLTHLYQAGLEATNK